MIYACIVSMIVVQTLITQQVVSLPFFDSLFLTIEYTCTRNTCTLRKMFASVGVPCSRCGQEFITGRVCNSHMVSTPAIWIG